MKKLSWAKRAAALGLIGSLAAGLCACGGKDKNENAAMAKEHVYRVKEIELPKIDGDDWNIYATMHRDGKVYLMMEVYHWQEEKEGDENDIRLLSIAEDGSGVEMVNLEMPKWERRVKPGAGDVPGTDPDGGVMPLTEPEPGMEGGSASEEDGGGGDSVPAEDGGGGDSVPAEEGGGGDSVPAEEGSEGDSEAEDDEAGIGMPTVDTEAYPMQNDAWENSYYNNYMFGADGRMYAIRQYSYNDYTNGINENNNYLVSWNQDGSCQGEKELGTFQSEEEYVYINAMTAAEDGTVTLMLNGEQAYMMKVDPQGNVGERKPLSEELSKVFSNCDRLIDKGDGTFLVIYYDQDDWTKQFITTYDPATDTLGQSTPMPAVYATKGFGNLNIGVNSDLICSSGDGIYTYKIGDEDFTEKMNYINSDLYISNFNSIVELGDESFLGVYYENYNEGIKAGVFTYVDPADIPDKSVLVLAGAWVGGDIERRVVKFNKESEQYRIVVKSYDSYNTYDDWQAGYTQLNNDVTTGKMPDILITDGLPVENYISKGLLADIGKMIEEDEELSQTEFVTNVFDAYSVEGRLYYVIPGFTVSTMVGKESIVGDRTSWTMEDMLELQKTLPEGTNMIGDQTRSGFFSTMMQFCGSDFVDVDTGKCEFDTDHFISMMEFAKTLPEELTEEYFGEDYWENYESQYRDGRTILCRVGIGSVRDMNYTYNGNFGGDMSFIGFPTESGSGSYVSATECYAISNKSRNKEGAWEFLRYYLTDEYQADSQSRWGMPVSKKYFDEMAKEGTQRRYWLDENGEKVEEDDYFYMNGESIKLDPLTQEQADKVVNFILSVDKCYYYNESIMNIINEEMDAFYTGQKSAKEVAKTIQNRAQLYVDENR